MMNEPDLLLTPDDPLDESPPYAGSGPAPTKENPDDDGEEVILSLKRKERSVSIEDTKGVVRRYILREILGPDRDKYINSMSSRAKGIGGGATILKDSEGVMADLISRHLWDDGNKRVNKQIIHSWPSSVQMRLFRICRKLSGLDEDREDLAKND